MYSWLQVWSHLSPLLARIRYVIDSDMVYNTQEHSFKKILRILEK